MTTHEHLSATFVGGPTLHLTYAGLGLLTDPTFDRPREYPAGGIVLRKLTGPAVGVDELPPVDVVLLSHDQHADNLDVAGRALLATVPLTLTTRQAAARIPGVVGLAPWQRHELTGPAGERIVVTAVPARHGPAGCEPISGEVTGFVLQADDRPTVYVSGDNAAVEVLAEITQRFTIDVAVLFVGAANVGRFGDENVTLGARDAAAVAPLLTGAVVVPVHAEDWGHFTEPLDDLVTAWAAADPAARIVVAPRGETITL